MQFTEENIRKLFGFEDAEGEPIERLRQYYFKNDSFEEVLSDLPLRLLVGHKGVGKSALFKVAMNEQQSQGHLTILIRPDDIAEIGEKHDTLLISINKWKFGLTSIITEKVLAQFGVSDDSFKGKIIQYGMKVTKLISDMAKPYLDEKVDFAPGKRLLVENFLKTEKVIVYLDDLDRGWQNRKEGVVMISALLNAIRDLSSINPGLSFKVSLRSDVYAAIRFEDESSDKFSGSVTWHAYSLHEIYVMLVMRVMSFLGQSINEENLKKMDQRKLSYFLEPIMDINFKGNGKWENAPIHNVILSLIRKRPRDIVKLCSLAARKARKDGARKITSAHWESVFEEFSQGVIHDTIVEYKTELADIERLIFGMKPSGKTKEASEVFNFQTAELKLKINKIIDRGAFRYANGKTASAQDLAQFLFKINFLTAWKRLDDGRIQRKYFEENNYLSSSFVDFGYNWEVHLAYRWALQPDTLEHILSRFSIVA
ncbi:MAG: hypothetical protein JST26_04510 [Bacteroidetes bacterium]|nr:hypothetical protein [Bacteroidota bacterium]